MKHPHTIACRYTRAAVVRRTPTAALVNIPRTLTLPSLAHPSRSAAPLVYEESVGYSFYLPTAFLGGIVEHHDGEWKTAINKKTDIVVLGDTSRCHSKKNPDTWTGTAKHKAIAAQEALVAAGKRGDFEVISFLDFVKDFGLDAGHPDCDFTRMLCCAQYDTSGRS